MDLDVTALAARIGEEVAVSDWIEVTQDRIRKFADATDDHQWIHVDPARSAVESPYGTTIAHGFLTLSLVSFLARRAMRVTGVRMAINYGVNRVRFVTAVPAGSRIRGRFCPAAVDPAGGATQITWRATIDIEGGAKPAAVIEWLVRYYPA